jgi:uncharacterized protein YdeI (YjbR/CyaY-like superfamily)
MKAAQSEKPLFFKDRTEWRQWLEQNHGTSTGVWLIHYKKKSQKKSVTHVEAVDEALCFGWIDSILKKIDEDSFILKFSPRKSKSVWSKINKDKAEQLIAQGKMTPAGLEKIKEAQQHGLWDVAYTNKVKERLPTDLKQELIKNRAAWKHFQAFANSYRNMYIGWVKNTKNSDTRKRRIDEVVKRSELNKKPGID